MLRERQKEERRQQILAAAEALIRERGTTEFPMLDLSERAGLSPATPYNLFGSKLAILWTLLRQRDERYQMAFTKKTSSDPYLQVVEAVAVAVRVFTGDAALFKPLCAFLSRSQDAVYRPAYEKATIDLWIKITSDFPKTTLMPSGITHEIYSRQFLTLFIGAFDLWAQGRLSDEEVELQVQLSTVLTLMAIAPEPDRTRLAKHLSDLTRQLGYAEAPAVA
jgi:AcrR family transcriptional regulator